jgi:hypothetical protein
MLAVVARFKWIHINYLKALEKHFEVLVAWSGEGGKGAPQDGLGEGLHGVPIGWTPDLGAHKVRSRLERVLSEWAPDLVHLMYYNHDDLALMARELVGDGAPIVYECRDPQTTLSRAAAGSEVWARERDAILASDAQILVSEALRSYLERSHGLDLGETSLIVPASFARHTIAPPSPKLSALDGRVHIALVGTADDAPDHGRWYVEIIRRLVSLGLVVHSHFFEPPRFDMGGIRLDAYHALDAELDDYHFHPAVPHRQGTALSELVSRYDLMGVFHELGARQHNESATLAICLPTKAVCGWLHAGIPVVCFPHYQGVVEWIDALGIGFVIERWEGLAQIAADRAAIAAATSRCLASRDRFTNEHNAARIREFIDPLLAARARQPPARSLATSPRGAGRSAPALGGG